ncbi:hypothetical protein MBLNU459_g8383t1 [Dothideomycetes sp. NU459]
MSKSSLIASIEADRPAHIEFLQSLTRAASPNPPGSTVATSKVIADYLLQRKIGADTIEARKDMPNIVSSFEPAGEHHAGPRLVINGHMDVFPFSNQQKWKHGPWSGDVDDGRIFGSGVVDMKAGLAASVAAYAYLYANRSGVAGNAILEVVSDEETGGKWGSRYLIEEHPEKETWRGDIVLNAEPTALPSIRFAEKGTLRITFLILTRGAHGAYVHLSEGAIRIAARLIAELVKLEQFDEFEVDPLVREHLQRKDVADTIDEIMGAGASQNMLRPTVNIGTVRGGIKVNTIPDSCEFEVDIRLPVGLTSQVLLHCIDTILEAFPEASYQVQEAASNPSNACAPNHALVEAIQHNVTEVTGRRPISIPSMGGTDCKFWRYLGIPAYSYGLSPEGMAGIDESVDLNDYINLIKVLTLAAWDFLGGKE